MPELTVVPAAQGPPWAAVEPLTGHWAPLCPQTWQPKPPWALIPPHTKAQTASWLANHQDLPQTKGQQSCCHPGCCWAPRHRTRQGLGQKQLSCRRGMLCCVLMAQEADGYTACGYTACEVQWLHSQDHFSPAGCAPWAEGSLTARDAQIQESGHKKEF